MLEVSQAAAYSSQQNNPALAIIQYNYNTYYILFTFFYFLGTRPPLISNLPKPLELLMTRYVVYFMINYIMYITGQGAKKVTYSFIQHFGEFFFFENRIKLIFFVVEIHEVNLLVDLVSLLNIVSIEYDEGTKNWKADCQSQHFTFVMK